jgi:hypothetical protein
MRGMLAKYGTVPSAAEIDANRAKMFTNFAHDDLMLTAIADTYPAIWYLFSDPRLGYSRPIHGFA